MSTPPPFAGRRKLLVLELWGVGDLTMATTLLRPAVEAGWEVTLLAKDYARALLEPTYPEIRFLEFHAPWTAFRGKYRLWRWPHAAMVRLLAQLRREHFDAAVSVRADPRDDLLMLLAGVPERHGYSRPGLSRLASRQLLSRCTPRTEPYRHKVEDWRGLRVRLGLPAVGNDGPFLQPGRYSSPMLDRLLAGVKLPILCLHTGARVAVRRWPASYYAHVIRRLRERFHFHLLYVPESDGYGGELAPLADSVAPTMQLGEMVSLFGRIDLLLANDSGPGHVAASCGRPVIAVFGPGDPGVFRPWGEHHHVVIRDICALRPCYDYCIYPEPYCLTKLLPEPAAVEIENHLQRLIEAGAVPAAFRRL